MFPNKKIVGLLTGIALVILGSLNPLHARDYYVSVSGNDRNPGTVDLPLRRIQAAADQAMPGDTVIVREGVYRERIDPPRGGTSPEQRIVYRAAPGERVVITGSEQVNSWIKVNEGLWQLTVPNQFFKESNPFDELIYGMWYTTMRPNHTGAVYLNGKRMREAESFDALQSSKAETLWYAEADGNGGHFVMDIDSIQPELGPRYNSQHVTVEGGDIAIKTIKPTIPWAVGYLKDGAVLYYPNIDFGAGSKFIDIQVATMCKAGTIELRRENARGELLGQVAIENTGNWSTYKTFSLTLSSPIVGVHDIALVVKAPASVVDGKTTIWAQFPSDVDPNGGAVEISCRSTVFYPSKTGCDYISVSGFILENAACNFASPSAEQPGLIGPRWAKGWIIENNIIRNARCSGISLGRSTFGHSHHVMIAWGVPHKVTKVYPEPNCGQTEQQLIDYFTTMSWTKNEAGFHVVRNNTIYDCGQTGIVGSSGGAFSLIEGNEIFNIHVNETFSGFEMAAIKLHFPVDTIIRNNHLYSSWRGLWLDWGAQGVIVEGNLMHGNLTDISREVVHGPTLFANNILLSGGSKMIGTDGSAWVHNLIVQTIRTNANPRKTPVYAPHETKSVGLVDNAQLGDLQYINNIFYATTPEDNLFEVVKRSAHPVKIDGNVILGKSPQADGAHENDFIAEAIVPTITKRGDAWYLSFPPGQLPSNRINQRARSVVDSTNLGITSIAKQGFSYPDGSPIVIDYDYFGKPRALANPAPGPFELYEGEFKVWPK